MEHKIPEHLKPQKVEIEKPPLYIIWRDTLAVFLLFGSVIGYVLVWGIFGELKTLAVRVWKKILGL